MSDFSDSESDTESNFNSASNVVTKIHSKLSQADILELYGLYKQATCGQCNIPQPGIFHFQARSKWSAWDALGSMDQKEAKRLYTEKVERIDPEFRVPGNKNIGWVVHSVHSAEEEEHIEEMNKTAFDFVKENNLEGLKKVVVKEFLDKLDKDSGLGLIHWATDRNAVSILSFLLSSGANVNLQDTGGQTSLHYAASCGHVDCILLLLEYFADTELADNDGETPLDVAYDESIRELLRKT